MSKTIITTKQHWHDAHEQFKELRKKLSKPRCVNCLWQESGVCENFKAEIPEQHLYEPTDCNHHEDEIPF